MEKKGIRILCQTVIERVERDGNNRLCAFLSGGEIVEADQVMLALGRIPNT